MTQQLQFIRVYLGAHHMDVAVQTASGLKVVKVNWLQQVSSDIPPASWYELVKEELKYNQARKDVKPPLWFVGSTRSPGG
jgi:hypothetical protein